MKIEYLPNNQAQLVLDNGRFRTKPQPREKVERNLLRLQNQRKMLEKQGKIKPQPSPPKPDTSDG